MDILAKSADALVSEGLFTNSGNAIWMVFRH